MPTPQQRTMNAKAQPVDPWEHSTRVQEDAASLGFDWPSVDGVLDKIAEELDEIRAALADGDAAHARRELGDLLLATVNLARFLHADPARAVAEATCRFENRFDALRQELSKMDRSFKSCALDELEAIWQRVKHQADQRLNEGS